MRLQSLVKRAFAARHPNVPLKPVVSGQRLRQRFASDRPTNARLYRERSFQNEELSVEDRADVFPAARIAGDPLAEEKRYCTLQIP